MTSYTEVKEEHKRRYGQLFTDCGVFWAFNPEQYSEGRAKHPLQPGEKYIRIEGGGFMPKNNIDKLTAGLKACKIWKRQAMTAVKASEAILYELKNYECFEEGDYYGALEVLTDMGYNENQIRQVYREHQTAEGAPTC